MRVSSNAFRRYLELSKKPREEILAKLVAAGYAPDETAAELPEVQKAAARFHASGGRQHAATITNIRNELQGS